ncbi:hypothetical protein [Roseibacillus persicicus]|nr:hypothetical protein [Roseibacillus persicicus]MDQ8189022.1 hypothetical protein [Roseibacillus persicicus]
MKLKRNMMKVNFGGGRAQDRGALIALGLLATLGMAEGTIVLYSDNFNGPDSGSFDAASPPDGLRVGGAVAGPASYLQSFGQQQGILGAQLDMTDGGGLRFGPETSRFDWAAGSTGGDILGAGGIKVTFDWIHSGTSTEWIAWKVGTPNGDSGVNAGEVDHALLIRQSATGGGETNERWDNGANQGYSGVAHDSAAGTHAVELVYTFGSFADGTDVNLVATVDGVRIVEDTFTWDNNGGSLFMELATGTTENFVDNLVVSTVPEPSVSLLGLAGLGCLLRRRRG